MHPAMGSFCDEIHEGYGMPSVVRAIAVFFVIGTNVIGALGQKTVVRDAGAGMKEQVDYDASNQIVETRTIAADGKLLEKIDYQRVGTFVKTTMSTSYWQDGKTVQKVTRETFDENENFLSEMIADYDKSGQQNGGHQLFHEPTTGMFRCLNWHADSRNYVPIDCPASEESGRTPPAFHKATQDEVMKHLAAARKAAQAEEKSETMSSKAPVQASITTHSGVVGVVLPSRLRPGSRVSGSIVTDPDLYETEPGLMIVRMTVPFESAGEAATLKGWRVEAAGSAPQPADGPFTLTLPSTGGEFTITLRQDGEPSHSVSQVVKIPPTPVHQKSMPAQGYQSSPLCLLRSVCVVGGKFSGDSTKTFASFDSVPVPIVAESEEAAFVEVTHWVIRGESTLILAEGAKVVALPVAIAEFNLHPNHETLPAGGTMLVFANLDSAQEMPEELWLTGTYPQDSLEKAKRLVPGFNLSAELKNLREARERREKMEGHADKRDEKEKDKDEKLAGMIMLVIRNNTPDVATPRSSRNQGYVLYLTHDSFGMGDFTYKFQLEGIKTGVFSVRGTAIPFFTPVKGQVFEVAENASAQARN
jgi:hypothetical protein